MEALEELAAALDAAAGDLADEARAHTDTVAAKQERIRKYKEQQRQIAARLEALGYCPEVGGVGESYGEDLGVGGCGGCADISSRAEAVAAACAAPSHSRAGSPQLRRAAGGAILGRAANSFAAPWACLTPTRNSPLPASQIGQAHLQARGRERGQALAELARVESELQQYRGLPADVPVAQAATLEKRQELDRLRRRLKENLEAMA